MGAWISRASYMVYLAVTGPTSRFLLASIALRGSYGTDLREGVTVTVKKKGEQGEIC